MDKKMMMSLMALTLLTNGQAGTLSPDTYNLNVFYVWSAGGCYQITVGVAIQLDAQATAGTCNAASFKKTSTLGSYSSTDSDTRTQSFRDVMAICSSCHWGFARSTLELVVSSSASELTVNVTTGDCCSLDIDESSTKVVLTGPASAFSKVVLANAEPYNGSAFYVWASGSCYEVAVGKSISQDASATMDTCNSANFVSTDSFGTSCENFDSCNTDSSYSFHAANSQYFTYGSQCGTYYSKKSDLLLVVSASATVLATTVTVFDSCEYIVILTGPASVFTSAIEADIKADAIKPSVTTTTMLV